MLRNKGYISVAVSSLFSNTFSICLIIEVQNGFYDRKQLFVANIYTSGIHFIKFQKPYGKAAVAMEDWPLSPPTLLSFQSINLKISVCFIKTSQQRRTVKGSEMDIQGIPRKPQIFKYFNDSSDKKKKVFATEL